MKRFIIISPTSNTNEAEQVDTHLFRSWYWFSTFSNYFMNFVHDFYKQDVIVHVSVKEIYF